MPTLASCFIFRLNLRRALVRFPIGPCYRRCGVKLKTLQHQKLSPSPLFSNFGVNDCLTYYAHILWRTSEIFSPPRSASYAKEEQAFWPVSRLHNDLRTCIYIFLSAYPIDDNGVRLRFSDLVKNTDEAPGLLAYVRTELPLQVISSFHVCKNDII